MKKLTVKSILFCVIAGLAAGCAPVISKGLREQAVKGISFQEVSQEPETFKGKIVIWGGVIIDTKNLKDGTVIEVLEKPLDMAERPKKVDRSGGRFLAFYDGFLDRAVYGENREVTVGGEIIGKRVLPLGEIQYTYPLVSVKEIHMWPERPREICPSYPYLYYPYYPYDHWWWYHHHRFYH